MRKPTAPQLTKRQRKALRNPNAAVKQSLKAGERVTVAGVEYCGQNPAFAPIMHAGMITGHRQIRKGVPFVRVEPKHRYIA